MTFMSRTVLRMGGLLVMLGLPIAACVTGAAELAPFLAMPLVVLGGPMILRMLGVEIELSGSDEDGADESDGGGGGNQRPHGGPSTPSGPMGDLPLEFSSPGGWRLRGAGRQTVGEPGRRRAPHRPVRRPGRQPVVPRTR